MILKKRWRIENVPNDELIDDRGKKLLKEGGGKKLVIECHSSVSCNMNGDDSWGSWNWVKKKRNKFKSFKSFLPPQKFFAPYVWGRVKNFHNEKEYIDVGTFYQIDLERVKTW